MDFPGGSMIKNTPANTEDPDWIPGLGRSLEKETQTYSNIFAWEIPQTEEPGGLHVRSVKMNQGVLKGPEADQLWNLRSEGLGGYEL